RVVGHRDLERVVDRGQLALEHRVDDDAPDRDDLPEILPVSVRHVTPLWLREDASFRLKQAGFYQAGRPSGAGLRDTPQPGRFRGSSLCVVVSGAPRRARSRRSCTVDCWSRGSMLANLTAGLGAGAEGSWNAETPAPPMAASTSAAAMPATASGRVI